jgi:hypothetical protein
MRKRFSGSMIMVAIAAAAGCVVISAPTTTASAQAPAASGTMPAPAPSPKTAWGEPDLQGIWTDETATPLQRPARYANQEFFTEAERTELDRLRSEVLGRERRAERGTERDVSGSYNNVFVSFKRTGARTSLIVDPPTHWPDSAADAGGSEAGRRRAGVSSRAVAIDRNLQEQGGRL